MLRDVAGPQCDAVVHSCNVGAGWRLLAGKENMYPRLGSMVKESIQQLSAFGRIPGLVFVQDDDQGAIVVPGFALREHPGCPVSESLFLEKHRNVREPLDFVEIAVGLLPGKSDLDAVRTVTRA